MMKVFLVDDEIAIRENLRNSFPWEEKGYQLVGEAPDGEMALPMLRDLNADILLTDIRMPFMDGIKLCEEVQRTMPWVERIILSGYDDFTYAQKAISLGVKEYLLKPVTAKELEAALERVRRQIEEKRRDRENLTALRERLSSGNQFLRDKLLASLFTDEGDREDDEALLRQMRELGVNLAAGSYAVIDISFPAEGEERIACRNALTSLAEMSGGGVYVCGAPKGARALVLGDNPEDTEERAYSFANSAMHLPELAGEERLLISVGDTVTDFHEIRQSMKSARHARHLQSPEDRTERRIISVNESSGQQIPLSETELSPLYERLQYASEDEVEAILTEYTRSLDPTLALGYLRVAGLRIVGATKDHLVFSGVGGVHPLQRDAGGLELVLVVSRDRIEGKAFEVRARHLFGVDGDLEVSIGRRSNQVVGTGSNRSVGNDRTVGNVASGLFATSCCGEREVIKEQIELVV